MESTITVNSKIANAICSLQIVHSVPVRIRQQRLRDDRRKLLFDYEVEDGYAQSWLVLKGMLASGITLDEMQSEGYFLEISYGNASKRYNVASELVRYIQALHESHSVPADLTISRSKDGYRDVTVEYDGINEYIARWLISRAMFDYINDTQQQAQEGLHDD